MSGESIDRLGGRVSGESIARLGGGCEMSR